MNEIFQEIQLHLPYEKWVIRYYQEQTKLNRHFKEQIEGGEWETKNTASEVENLKVVLQSLHKMLIRFGLLHSVETFFRVKKVVKHQEFELKRIFIINEEVELDEV